MIRNLKLVLLFCLFAFHFGCADSQAEQIVFPTDVLAIQTQTEKVEFDIELALTSQATAAGLMFRRELAEKNGMLFIFPEKDMVYMWMKNTYIPLDMLFIDESGTIVNIVKNTKPKSLETISSGKEAKAVLELNAGITDKYGINIGDEVLYNAFTD